MITDGVDVKDIAAALLKFYMSKEGKKINKNVVFETPIEEQSEGRGRRRGNRNDRRDRGFGRSSNSNNSRGSRDSRDFRAPRKSDDSSRDFQSKKRAPKQEARPFSLDDVLMSAPKEFNNRKKSDDKFAKI